MTRLGIALRQHADNRELLRQSACFRFTKCNTLAAVRKADTGDAMLHAGDQAQSEGYLRLFRRGAPHFIAGIIKSGAFSSPCAAPKARKRGWVLFRLPRLAQWPPALSPDGEFALVVVSRNLPIFGQHRLLAVRIREPSLRHFLFEEFRLRYDWSLAGDQ